MHHVIFDLWTVDKFVCTNIYSPSFIDAILINKVIRT